MFDTIEIARTAAQRAANRYQSDMDIYQVAEGFEVTYSGERPYNEPATIKETVFVGRPGRHFMYEMDDSPEAIYGDAYRLNPNA